jgi:hypothetical protein
MIYFGKCINFFNILRINANYIKEIMKSFNQKRNSNFDKFKYSIYILYSTVDHE